MPAVWRNQNMQATAITCLYQLAFIGLLDGLELPRTEICGKCTQKPYFSRVFLEFWAS
jgi:hypothetical protein